MAKVTKSGFLIEQGDSMVRILIRGELSMVVVPEMREILARTLSTMQFDTLEVDLSETIFMDSTGISFLIAQKKIAIRDGKAMRLRNPSPPVMNILTLVQLISFFEVVDQP